MKKILGFLLILVIITGFNFTIYGVSPSKYLNSRLTVLSSRLLQEVSSHLKEGEDYRYSLGLLPLVDVNGEDSELSIFLNEKITEVISENPFFRLASIDKTSNYWNELTSEDLTEKEIFYQMGESLNISGLVMINMVTHSDKLILSAIIVNTATGQFKSIEPVELDADTIRLLPYKQEEIIEIPEIEIAEPLSHDENRTNNDNKTDEVTNKGDNNDSSLDFDEAENSGNFEKAEQTSDKKNNEELNTELIHGEELKDGKNGELISSEEDMIEITDDVKKPDKLDEGINIILELTGQSPLMNNLLLGFTIGDVDGDLNEELILCGGDYIQVRNLTDYDVLWTKIDYMPLSNDFKILSCDIDYDGKAEIIGHGNLLKLDNDQLINIQPRFIARPVTLYKEKGIGIFNQGMVYLVNYQGLILKRFPLGEDYGKRFIFTDLEGDGIEELITTMQGEDEGATIKVFESGDGELIEKQTLESEYGYAIHTLDLNNNGLPEVYLRRNFFAGDDFLYSKIYILESKEGKLDLLGESPELDYFIVDFASYPESNPTRLVVGGMYLKNKNQSLGEIRSRIFYYTLK